MWLFIHQICWSRTPPVHVNAASCRPNRLSQRGGKLVSGWSVTVPGVCYPRKEPWAGTVGTSALASVSLLWSHHKSVVWPSFKKLLAGVQFSERKKESSGLECVSNKKTVLAFFCFLGGYNEKIL